MNTSARRYHLASASVFALLAMFQLGRALLDIPVQIAGTTIARRYHLASASVFALLAMFQLGRALLDIPVQIAGTTIPVAVSLVVAFAAGGLAAWGWRSR
jgi:hypothetical protein